jgi:hypothetical protein
MAKTPKSSNLAVADAADKQKLEAIRSLIQASDDQFVGSRRALYEALGTIFDLTNTLVNDNRLEGFATRQGQKWGKVALGNPFQPLTTLAFNKSRQAAAASKYAKVLQYAAGEKPKAVSFADWIESSGGIEELVALARVASADPLERYEERPDERYTRAIAALAQQSMGRLPDGTQIDLPSSYGRALVRQVSGRLEVVGIVPLEGEALKSDIFALVPAEPPRARQKLRDKQLYEIFRMCDLAIRWFPKSSFSDETFLVDEGLSAENYTLALHAAVKKPSVSKKVDLARYSPQAALRFRHYKGYWHVETVSTHPSFPVFQCRLTMALPELDTAMVYMLHAAQVNRVAITFAAVADWTIRLRKPTSKQGHDAGSDGEIVFDRITHSYAWRELAKPKTRRAKFELSRAKLNAIGSWFENFRAVSKAAKFGRLPQLMALRHVDGVSIVVPLADSPDQGDDLVTWAQQERQRIGTLPFAPAQALDSVSDDLSDRFLKRQDLMRLVSIAADYGINFDCQFLEHAEGVAGLSASSDNWSVVIPLVIGLSGQYAEIVALIDNTSERANLLDAGGVSNHWKREAQT